MGDSKIQTNFIFVFFWGKRNLCDKHNSVFVSSRLIRKYACKERIYLRSLQQIKCRAAKRRQAKLRTLNKTFNKNPVFCVVLLAFCVFLL